MLMFYLCGALLTAALFPDTQVGRALYKWLVVKPADALNAMTLPRFLGWLALLVFIVVVSRSAPAELASVVSFDYALLFEIAAASMLASGVARLRILGDMIVTIKRRCVAVAARMRAATPRARTARLKRPRRTPPVEDDPAWAFA